MKLKDYFGRCKKCQGIMLGHQCPNCTYMATMTFAVLDVTFVPKQCGESIHRSANGHITNVSCMACASTGFISWNLDMGRPALVSGDFLESARKAKIAFEAAA